MNEWPFVTDFTEGASVETFLFVRSKEEKNTKAGDPYLDLVLADSSGSISAKAWADVLKEVDASDIDGAVKVRGIVGAYRDKPQLNVKKIRPVKDSDQEQGFDQQRLFEVSQYNREEMFSGILEFLERLEEEALKAMMEEILGDVRDLFMSHSASRSLHHAFKGGLLEHTLSVLHTGVYLAEKFGLNRDVVICGAILHDLAKTVEISADSKRDYTTEGRLVGHIVLGRDLLNKYASRFEDLSKDTLLHLEHIILSHQGEKEWASPVLPQTPEAMAVHFADNIDAKMEMFKKVILHDPGKEEDFQYHRALERYIYKKGPADFKGKYPFF